MTDDDLTAMAADAERWSKRDYAGRLSAAANAPLPLDNPACADCPDAAAVSAEVLHLAADCAGDLVRHVATLVAEVRRLRAAASAVLFWRHADGTFVDGFMAQEKLNALAATFPPGYTHWPMGEAARAADPVPPGEVTT